MKTMNKKLKEEVEKYNIPLDKSCKTAVSASYVGIDELIDELKSIKKIPNSRDHVFETSPDYEESVRCTVCYMVSKTEEELRKDIEERKRWVAEREEKERAEFKRLSEKFGEKK